MRKIFLIITVALFSPVIALNAQNSKSKTNGSGNVITKDISIQSFDELKVSGVFDLVLSQGNKEELKIEAEDNLQDLFEVKNEGSKLIIKFKKDINLGKHKDLKVYLSFKKIKALDLKTVGNVTCAQQLSFDDLKLGNHSVGDVNLKFTARNLDMENQSVGDVTLNGKAESAVIKNQSVGDFQASSFVVQKLDINSSGIGSVEVNAEKELKVKDNSLGNVTNKGAAPKKSSKKQVI